MNLFLYVPEEIRIAGEKMRWHNSIFNISKLGQLHRVNNLPDVTVSTFANYINYDHD